MRYIDVIAFHDGTEGPAGVPRTCVEYDGARALEHGAVRMTVEEYRAQQERWDKEWKVWLEEHPAPPEAYPTLPDTLPAWACKAALDEVDMLGFLRAVLNDAPAALRWRFDAATRWHRADIEALGDYYNISPETREQLWARAAEVAREGGGA